jgi:hypothetical protein
MSGRKNGDRTVSVVVPAHNEGAVLGRLLSGLLDGARPGSIEVVVVANGCTDDTADVARSFAAGEGAQGPAAGGTGGAVVRVIETSVANKYHAMRLADAEIDAFPRVYVDADVELGYTGVMSLAEVLCAKDENGSESGGERHGEREEAKNVLAAAPEREVPLDGCPWTVRWYYAVWERLPTVRSGLFGRGVIGVSEAGYQRLRVLPELMGDDLAASLSFTDAERRIVPDAVAIVHPPRTCRDLIRRRVRTATVTAQAGRRAELSKAGGEARTSRADLLGVLKEAPLTMAPRLAWFLCVTVVARRRARRMMAAGDYSTWLRDESSRAAAAAPSTTERSSV